MHERLHQGKCGLLVHRPTPSRTMFVCCVFAFIKPIQVFLNNNKHDDDGQLRLRTETLTDPAKKFDYDRELRQTLKAAREMNSEAPADAAPAGEASAESESQAQAAAGGTPGWTSR